MDEYIRLEEIKKKRKLTEEEQRRWDEIQRSEAFKKYAQSTAEFAQNNGIKLPSLKSEAAQKYSSSSGKEYKSREFNIHAELAKKSHSKTTDLDDRFARETRTASMDEKVMNPSAFQDTSMKSSWNVVDMKQAFHVNSMTTDVTASKPVTSKIELIQENKVELLEPSNKQLEQPSQTIAAAPSAAAGFSL